MQTIGFKSNIFFLLSKNAVHISKSNGELSLLRTISPSSGRVNEYLYCERNNKKGHLTDFVHKDALTNNRKKIISVLKIYPMANLNVFK